MRTFAYPQKAYIGFYATMTYESVAIAYHGNIVSVWERLANEDELLVDLGSDQTSLHNPYGGGYYPVQLSFDDARALLEQDPKQFRVLVDESLQRHVAAVNALAAKGMRFWDYGNSLLLQSSRAGADVFADDGRTSFKYPTYVQEFMGDIFSLGFGPFRWVCCSGDEQDLLTTDRIAADVMRELLEDAPPRVARQIKDNLLWIERAHDNRLVVGSQARILYSDAHGRTQIAARFNAAIAQAVRKR